jgi:hypothetical protein
VIGCLVVLGLCVACCAGSLFFGFRFVRNIGAQVVQQQATAMGTGNYAEVCSHNSPTLNATTPCAQYVAWLNTYAPWFTGATITADDVSFKSDPNRGARITVRAAFPHSMNGMPGGTTCGPAGFGSGVPGTGLVISGPGMPGCGTTNGGWISGPGYPGGCVRRSGSAGSGCG